MGKRKGFATDPIADMLTRIRNANQMRYTEVEVPASNIKIEMAKILKIRRSKAYALIKEKGFPIIKIGKCIRISQKSIFSWLNKQ